MYTLSVSITLLRVLIAESISFLSGLPSSFICIPPNPMGLSPASSVEKSSLSHTAYPPFQNDEKVPVMINSYSLSLMVVVILSPISASSLSSAYCVIATSSVFCGAVPSLHSILYAASPLVAI